MTTTDMLPADADAQRSAIQSYRLPAKLFHWLTVALVVFMVSSAVIAKQLNGGPWSDTLFMLHKTTGIITLAVVLMRLLYRIVQWLTGPQPSQPRRIALHWLLYATVIAVPLAGWAGISDFGSREIFPGFTVPAIWPEHAGYADALFTVHAYLAFSLLALVALHIGIAIQDHMTGMDDREPHHDQEP
jgi:cytochrome b561